MLRYYEFDFTIYLTSRLTFGIFSLQRVRLPRVRNQCLFFFFLKSGNLKEEKNYEGNSSFLLTSVPFPELTIQSPPVAYNFVSHRWLPHVHYVILVLS